MHTVHVHEGPLIFSGSFFAMLVVRVVLTAFVVLVVVVVFAMIAEIAVVMN